VTIADIAERAGVSKGAVSYALNDRPGVSDATRARVLAIAAELGWSASHAARSLSTSRADAIGLVLARPARLLGVEPFYMEFISGIEEVLAPLGVSLMLRVVAGRDEELEAYRRWWAQGRVDGVLLVDLAVDDPRPAEVRRIGIPAFNVSSSAAADGLPHIWTDDGSAMIEAMQHLVGLGHRAIARVGGIRSLSHVRVRDEAFVAAAADAGLPAPTILETDFTGEAGADATRALLSGAEPPTAIVYDNDIMAVAGLAVAGELGVAVPGRLSIIAWDDSPICEITNPPLSAMRRDVQALGAAATRMLLRVIAGEEVEPERGPSPSLLLRGSTAAAG
jgi:DNA-binding LacI/PurR family transcriptional regulator